MAKPKAEYTYPDTVEFPFFVKSELPKGIFNTMVKQVQKDYPRADAIIFKSYEMTSAEAVMFEDWPNAVLSKKPGELKPGFIVSCVCVFSL